LNLFFIIKKKNNDLFYLSLNIMHIKFLFNFQSEGKDVSEAIKIAEKLNSKINRDTF